MNKDLARDMAAVAIRALDRSVLGRFALPEDTLIDAYSYMVVTSMAGGFEITLDAKNKLLAEMVGVINEVIDKFSSVELASELTFFGLQCDLAVIVPDFMARLDFLKLVSKHDESYHDYFAIGLTDTDYIERCIQDGVDPELAVRLVSNEHP